MKRLSCPLPSFASLATALMALAVLHAVLPPVAAQSEVPPPVEGSHLLRRILNEHDLQSLDSLEKIDQEPERTLLIVLGETDVLQHLPISLEEFVKNGGAALVATDRDADLDAFGVSVVGKLVKIDPASKSAYQQHEDCILVEPRDAGAPIFKGLKRVATNRPGYLRLQNRAPSVWAAFPRGATAEGRQDRFRSLIFAVGGSYGNGRVLFLSDHSVFINAMLWQTDNNNLEFTYNCIEWLTEKKRNRVLLIEEGTIQTAFDIPLKEIPLPPLESIVRAVDEGLRGMESENRFNLLIQEAMGRIPHSGFIKGLLILSALAIGVVGLIWLSLAKHHWEPGTPTLEGGLAQLVPSSQVVAQRHRTMLREGNFWEEARGMARQGLESILGTPPVQARAALPRLRVVGNWREYWQWRRRVKKLWRLAYGTAPRRITAAQFTGLRAEMDAVKAAMASGSLQIGKPHS